ncbi:Os11g0593900 [Oryza sativa Japonica Group]|uniref:Uncharacterized protein n=3 Tax=Oryza sativa TaxID=4530 RepID=A0A8J8YSI3_ORYSJ|nr:hypothetical protein OsI_14929 [Oryza sativa Indica Group]EEE52381.1 hypothetical protein OsJ_34470 [Oryza sativa Japonica Group]BAT14701.1 Os11g0593900 [Oryza sativa Japonica Group]
MDNGGGGGAPADDGEGGDGLLGGGFAGPVLGGGGAAGVGFPPGFAAIPVAGAEAGAAGQDAVYAAVPDADEEEGFYEEDGDEGLGDRDDAEEGGHICQASNLNCKKGSTDEVAAGLQSQYDIAASINKKRPNKPARKPCALCYMESLQSGVYKERFLDAGGMEPHYKRVHPKFMSENKGRTFQCTKCKNYFKNKQDHDWHNQALRENH